MADITLSLDDIIKKKKIHPFKNQNAKLVKTIKDNKASVKRIGQKQPQKIIATNKKMVTDLRNKIIHKKKTNIGDARERLGQLAKGGDARERLNKLKKGKIGMTATSVRGQVQTAKNLAKQNVTGKNRMHIQGKTVNRNMNIQRMPAHFKQMQRRDQNVQHASYQQQGMRPDMVWDNGYHQELIYNQAQPVAIDDYYPMYHEVPMQHDYISTEYVDEFDAPIRGAPIRRPVFLTEPGYVDAPMRRPVYVDAPVRRPVYAEAPQRRPVYAPISRSATYRVKTPQPSSSNLSSRVVQQKPQPQQGYKVLMTNLHPNVCEGDIKELFNHIGRISRARFIRKGVAEAIFVNRHDALRAVEEYHNRQLDGYAMNVTLIKQTSNALRRPQPKSVSRTANGRHGY